MDLNHSNELESVVRIVAITDFAGYSRAFDQHDDAAMARFINQYYALAVETITRHGGQVVKFIGDACLAVFDERAGPAAVSAVLELRRAGARLTAACGIDVALGARVHCGVVVEGLYGPPGHSHYDLIGSAVNTTAMMGGGSDVWISDAVYEQLDDEARPDWKRAEARATERYVYSPMKKHSA